MIKVENFFLINMFSDRLDFAIACMRVGKFSWMFCLGLDRTGSM